MGLKSQILLQKRRGRNLYATSHCLKCTVQDQCTTGKSRRIKRWEHEATIDALEDRMEQQPEMMRVRRSTVEHAFATLKCWMGYTHFKMKRLKHVSTEMSLHILAYNMKRTMNILGVNGLIEAI